MGKIGRNAPCPCGSGKKFKKCCIDKDIPSNLETSRNYHWSIKDVEALTTNEIISKLRDFGVDFDETQFLEDVKKFYSACDLADYWKQKFTITAKGFDRDFIFMACIVLWQQLAPEVINNEMIDDLMQKGYDLIQAGDKVSLATGCVFWLQVWEYLKHRFTKDMRNINDAEKSYSGIQSLFNWCQDVEQELHNAGIHDKSFYQKRIDYCREFCSFFPDSDELLVFNMKKAEAESYFFIGKVEEGEKAFKALIEKFPDNAWSYIGWGDMYSLYNTHEVDKDLNKAKHLYEMALHIDSNENEIALERLKMLNID